MLVASAHVAVAPPGGGALWENTSAGMMPGAAVGAMLPRVRLFDSPVHVCRSHEGPVVTPLATPERTVMVVPVPKTARLPLPSPNTLNSDSCHWLPRSGK